MQLAACPMLPCLFAESNGVGIIDFTAKWCGPCKWQGSLSGTCVCACAYESLSAHACALAQCVCMCVCVRACMHGARGLVLVHSDNCSTPGTMATCVRCERSSTASHAPTQAGLQCLPVPTTAPLQLLVVWVLVHDTSSLVLSHCWYKHALSATRSPTSSVP